MSIFPDWLEIDIGTGVTTVVDQLEVELEGAITVEIVDDTIEVEVY